MHTILPTEEAFTGVSVPQLEQHIVLMSAAAGACQACSEGMREAADDIEAVIVGGVERALSRAAAITILSYIVREIHVCRKLGGVANLI